ncbi:MAG: 23S rRNA (adenine(2503)-C(2))-methyltransferase RlmN [Lachnospiraceae bacterium]|jgi:23S rRNA (adenine2503-C2)-methyltransferase|nr:23S rRNA (adenine(2503)-C(2))-methyltransferase RlmN [Lachnospiraceae bacterium]
MEKQDLKSLTIEELTKELTVMGYPAFRARQVYQWLHEKLAESFDEMTNLPKEMRRELSEAYYLKALQIVDIQISKIDGTRKYLFALGDGNIIESVWMKYKHGNSVCISSQVGCRMGCRFCASTLDGLERNLLPWEMLDQVYRIQKETGERVSNVVVMGSGEPLDNYDNLVRFIRLLSGEGGLHISQRNITVSTCGIVPGIKRLSKEGLGVTLALSLHAPNDKVRETLMPIAKTYRLEEVLEACHEYFVQTGRRVTFEYSLVKGVNDTQKEARALGVLLKGREGHVNLIPVNPIKERDFKQSDQAAVCAFKILLEKTGINVTIRREMGRDINGACGQLRKRYLESQNQPVSGSLTNAGILGNF